MAVRTARVAAEIEVKLEAASPAELRHIAELRTIDGYELRPRPAARLHSLYLDTHDLVLARLGVGLRLRRGPGGWEATAKWAGRVAGSLHERPELNVRLAGRPRMPFVLPPGPLHTQLAATVLGRPLRPILVSNVQRRLLDLLPARSTGRRRSALAEIALDSVRMCAPDGRVVVPPYSEVEIELRAGERRDLTVLGRALQERFGLIPSHASKFARGLAALHGSGAHPAALEPIRAADNLAVATRTVVARQLARLRARDPDARVGKDPEAVHDMRVAVRRLRASLRTFAAAFSSRTYEQLNRELQWLGHELGAVRDLDVQLANLEWHRTQLQPSTWRPIDALRRHMRRERGTRRAALVAALDSRRYFRLLAALERFALSQPPRRPRGPAAEPIAEVGRRAIKKALRRLTARGEAIGDLPEAADLHALRIRAKRLRYLLEALRPITGVPGRKLTRQLVRLQDLLGRFNDAMVAARFVRTYAKGADAALDADAQQVFTTLADGELRRAGAAQADFQRAWRRFTSKGVRHLPKAMLKQLKVGAAAPASGPADEPVRQEGSS